jgi:hypothetical protein
MGNVYVPYVRLTTGSLTTQLDPAAVNTVGVIYSPPVSATLALTAVGYAAQPVVKYCYYNSTTNPTPVAGSAPVYYTDASFTTVSGNAAEAYFTTDGICLAGYLLPNTTSVSGLTAAQLNKSYCWVQVGGYLTGAWNPAGTVGVGASISGLTTGNWASTATAAGTAPLPRAIGYQWTAIASNLCSVLCGINSFWGS